MMETTIVPKYSFISSKKIHYGLNDKKFKQSLEKWGINFQIQHFSFNEPFHQYHKYHLVEAFFKDPIVADNLRIWINNSFSSAGLVASHVEMKQIPCSITSMSFFDKLKNTKNNIVNNSGSLRQRMNSEINGILVADNLRAMLLDEECNEYSLYSQNERDEFIFRIFQLLVLGGEYCQYEDDLAPYLEATKLLYKNLISIKKHQDSNIFISTIVLQVVAKIDTPYFPKDPNHRQNVGFLLVNSDNREITSFLHQYSGY